MKTFCEARTHYGELEENCINVLCKMYTQKVFTRFTLHFGLHVYKVTS